MSRGNEYDAIVVGSGITGGWAAKELTEKGLRVLLLDRGAPLEHGDYPGEHTPNWAQSFGGLPDREINARDYPIQSNCYAFDEATRDFFINDRQDPYDLEGNSGFHWIRGSRFGGRSVTWGRQAYRWGPQEFESNGLDGHGVDWPIRYQDLKDWYGHVERFIGVSGQAEGVTSFPDGEFQPPMDLYAIEKTVKRRMARKCPELTFTIGRTAVLTQDHMGRQACHYCGPCARGCSTGSYFSTQTSTLPAAQATGLVTVRPNSVVKEVLYDSEKGRASGVQVIDAESGGEVDFTSDLVFLCASTIASAQILLNSRSQYFPDGLANSSGAVGRYLMDHSRGPSGIGVFFDDLDRYYSGFRPNGSYIPKFRNLDGQDEDADFIRGYGYQIDTARLDYRFLMHQTGIGAAYKDAIRKPGPWAMILGGYGECLPRADNRITLDHNRPDRFGMPRITISMSWGENENIMRRDMRAHADRILKAAGAVVIQLEDESYVSDGAIHEMGTVRMGREKDTSVLNGWCQAHDVPNLFVTDGAAMASSGYVNPSLTYMALTARACNYAAEKWHRGEI